MRPRGRLTLRLARGAFPHLCEHGTLKSPNDPTERKATVRTRTPRPDEMTRETFEFITAVDRYKRQHLRSFLSDEEVLSVFYALGYRLPGTDRTAEPEDSETSAYADSRQRYRIEEGRLFPTWSEVYDLLLGLGYQRKEDSAA